MLADADWSTVLEPVGWVYPWCWRLESDSLASALVVFLFDNPAVSLFFPSFALTLLLCACTLER